MVTKRIEDFLDQEVKEFSISVIKERALPHVIDGFKPSQRKIIFTAAQVAKSFMKTSSLCGYVSPIAGYDKGDNSIPSTLIKMVQGFPGSNNIPFLEGSGTFGSRFIPDGAAAPRYTKAKIGQNFYEIFTDPELHTYTEQGAEGIFEPDYYIPKIPGILLNGTKGIAVGYACEFQPYRKEDIINSIKVRLNNENVASTDSRLQPYYAGYKGEIVWNSEEQKFIMFGRFSTEIENRNLIIDIDEIPTGISREKYITHLNNLVEKEVIQDYEDLCSKKGFRFILTMDRKNESKIDSDSFYQLLKLKKILNENLNAITERNTLIQFNHITEIIDYFVAFKLNLMKLKKQFHINRLDNEIEFLEEKMNLIKQVMNKRLDFLACQKRKDLEKLLKEDYKFWKRLINLPLYSFTKEEFDKTLKECQLCCKGLRYYKEVTSKNLFMSELEMI